MCTKLKDFGNIDEETLKKFIGKNADKILEQSFSIPALLFAPFYAAYRKMFKYSVIYTLITIIAIAIQLLFGKAYFLIIDIIMNILFGFFANKLYIKHAIKKISKIANKNEYNNAKYDYTKKGGTSISLAILFAFLEIITTIVIVSILVMTIFATMFSDAVKIKENFGLIEKNNLYYEKK